MLVVAAAGWGTSEVMGLRILGWQWILMTGGTLLPLATFLMFKAIRPYGEEVVRLEALGR